MEPSEAGAARPVVGPADRLEELSASARGWHTIHMAALGFIGTCGVLFTTDSPASRAARWLAAVPPVGTLAPLPGRSSLSAGSLIALPAVRAADIGIIDPLAISGGS
jgi:hypothetical protein